jgi:hypothetical protein
VFRPGPVAAVFALRPVLQRFAGMAAARFAATGRQIR